MRAPGSEGCLVEVCKRWIYSTCLCFALDTEEQKRSLFRYSYSVYQAEYRRNLLFSRGCQMQKLFDEVIHRTRVRFEMKKKTIFGYKRRPYKS